MCLLRNYDLHGLQYLIFKEGKKKRKEQMSEITRKRSFIQLLKGLLRLLDLNTTGSRGWRDPW